MDGQKTKDSLSGGAQTGFQEMLTNCGQETRETRFTRRQDELSPGGVRGQMKSQLVLQAP